MANSLYSYLIKINVPNIAFEDLSVIAKEFLAININDFYGAIAYVHNLPYGRTSDRENYRLVLKEKRGVCSNKHALIAQLAKELNIPLHLKLGLVILDEINSPKIANILRNYQLAGIPETHSYLIFEKNRLDITFPNAKNYEMSYPLLKEIFILPSDIGDFKIAWHKKAIKEWLAHQNLNYSVEEIWKIREFCISTLSTI